MYIPVDVTGNNRYWPLSALLESWPSLYQTSKLFPQCDTVVAINLLKSSSYGMQNHF